MTNTILRIPDDLYEKLKEIANLEDRSINKQITHIIRKYVEDFYKSQDG